MNTNLRNKAKYDLGKYFFNWWIMQFLEKLWIMWENIEILNLSQQKKEETNWCQNQIIIYKDFQWTFIINRNKRNAGTYE